MDSHDQENCVQQMQRIRELNDRLRTTGQGGRIMLTRTVAELSVPALEELISAVRNFAAFSKSNDPYGEHDFGNVEVDGVSYFWKVDCYDLNLEFGSPDPADETRTRRILTILAASEW